MKRVKIVYPAKCLKKMLVEGGKEFKVGRASLKSKGSESSHDY